MSSFTETPTVKPLGNGIFALTQSFEYYYAVGKNKTHSIIVPKGFKTNFASVPWLLHPILKPDNPKIMNAAIVHDYLYSGECPVNPKTKTCYNRKESDTLMFDMMRVLGASIFVSTMVYLAIRWFGAGCFKRRKTQVL